MQSRLTARTVRACFVSILLALCLAACARQPAPVRFHAEGNPPKLSDWNVVTSDGKRLALNAGVVPFDLNTPLFSDYAHKLRTVWMPEGKAAQYHASESFDFPVGTILSKTFYYPKADPANRDAVARTYDQSGDHAGEGLDLDNVRMIETRLLVRREAGWIALAYVWNAEQTEAELARTGDSVPLQLVADGSRQDFTYQVPDQNQCAGCHASNNTTRQIVPLGPKARHLDRDYAYADGSRNQLAHLAALGYLQGLPAEDVPRNADWQDAARASLDDRARAYLDINCGHCHNAQGPADTSGLWLDVGKHSPRHLGLCKPPIAAGPGTGGHRFGIVPGKPDESILAFRMDSDDPGVMMPELGRDVVHEEGVALIRDWISAMEGDCN
ncbi:putative repeat protein (TIGR03806 family) [Luteimonas cucumeris]|uniref:Putative repeat protein (TIGR03806 family) n=1 Tax=Luteimonas cucumeris TaxID=985012 RepID=A0A562LF17_9GAMM|nr:SO2930 family diheme c-type cytochrome [Luteimonas cucumeris]TWI06195.1 putative repeat protein (TIGR03806 family) [Luteimonas cucumeris]